MSFDEKDLPPLIVRYSDGGTFAIRAARVTDFVFDPNFLKFFTLQFLITALLLEPYGTEIQTAAHAVVIWVLTFTLCMTWLLVASTVTKFLWVRGRIDEIHTLAIVLPMIALGQSVMRGMDYLETGEFASLGLFDVVSILRVLVVAICFDIIHGRFVAPFNKVVISPFSDPSGMSQREILPDIPVTSPLEFSQAAGAKNKPKENLPKTAKSWTSTEPNGDQNSKNFAGQMVQIGARNFQMGSITMIRSEEHYLRIYTDTETVLIRGKLSEAEAKLDPRQGMQINRSIWLAYRSISALDVNDRGRLEVITNQDEVIAVPSSRKIALTQNYRNSQLKEPSSKSS